MSTPELRDGSRSARSAREEEELMRASRELLARDKLSALASRPSRTSQEPDMRAMSELFARETAGIGLEPSMESRRRQESYEDDTRGLSSSMQELDDTHDRLSIRSEESEDNSIDQEKGLGIRKVEDYVDVEALSAASRRTAAPHIYNIFEQIFIQGTDAESKAYQVPDLPEALRESLRASGRYVEGQFGLAGPRAQVHVELDQSTDVALARGKKAFMKQVAADLAVALRVEKARLEVVEVGAGLDGERAVVELQVLPDKDGKPPSALEVCEALRADVESRNSVVRAMTSTRRAVDVKYREMQPQGGAGAGMQVAMPGAGAGQQYEFSLIRGGIVLDERGARPAMSAVREERPVQLAAPPPDEEERRERRALHAALQEEEREVAAARQVEAARGEQEGFWVDVEGGKARQSAGGSGAYGTFVAQTPRGRLPGAVLVVLYAGGLLMVSMALWLLYYRFVVTPASAGSQPPSS